MDRMLAFVRLSRLHFLAGGFLMYGIGAATVSGVEAGRYWLGQLVVTASQLTAHYVNEHADLEHDRLVQNRTFFSGGSGVLVEGRLAPAAAWRAAWATTTVALVGAVALGAVNGWAGALGLAALTVSWSYSMPPARLLGRGLGELATSVVVAGAVPLIGSLAQDATPSSELWWSVAVLVPAHAAMMTAFEVPDLGADSVSGKRVLAVRLGRPATDALIVGLVVVASALAVVGEVRSPWLVPALVPAGVMVSALRTERHSVLTVSAVAMFVVAGLGLLVGSS